ncbi:feruloyl esterase, partial [Micromonospora orduensis]
ATPTPTPTPTPSTPATCVTASNYAHVAAGRAYQSGGYAYANGSNQRMGLYNTFYTSALKQTGPNYWVIGC